MKTLLLAGALALSPAVALAQSAPAPQTARAPMPDANPALWVVRDEDTTIYLFGTFHLLDGRPWFNDEVRTAFDASSELVLEAILPENQMEMMPLITRYAIDPQGRSLSARLSPAQNEALGRALTALGVPAGGFDRFEPWFVAMTLPAVATQQLGLDTANAPETVLSQAARERHMTVSELEGLEWQIRMMDGMPEAQQLAELRDALDELDTMAAQLTPMLAAWSTGDVDGLQRIVDAQGDDDPDLHRLLFTDRNAAWARWIQQRLARPGTVFIAVGAGHLAGADSVRADLQALGLRVERVRHAAASPAS
jgi:uncharacterized protein YbaP (TraB family)